MEVYVTWAETGHKIRLGTYNKDDNLDDIKKLIYEKTNVLCNDQMIQTKSGAKFEPKEHLDMNLNLDNVIFIMNFFNVIGKQWR